MVEKRWVVLNETGKDLREILIKNRNIKDPDSFFQPHLYKLTSPDKLFADLDRAVERIKRAIKNKELVYIYGDFDVDGITATAILWETIHFLGGKVLPFIPHREKEGYGIHTDVLETLAKDGAKVIVSVDCGITAVEEAEIARKLGVDLIITDHHLIQSNIPKPLALLHCDKLAGAGVAFMLAKALLEAFHKKDDEQLYANLGLAGIGTIADMVPLTGDNRIITVNGFSKVYAMTGWRLGYAAGPEEIIKAATNIQDHTTSGANSVAQKAGVEALKGNQDSVTMMVREFDKRRKYIVERLNKIKGISCLLPQGAFYAFPKVSDLYTKKISGQSVTNSFDLVNLLLEKAHVAFVPGAPFGSDEYIRISYATSMKNIEKGIDRFEKFLGS